MAEDSYFSSPLPSDMDSFSSSSLPSDMDSCSSSSLPSDIEVLIPDLGEKKVIFNLEATTYNGSNSETEVATVVEGVSRQTEFIMTWNDAHLSANLLENVLNKGFLRPEGLQKILIPLIQDRYDVKCTVNTSREKITAYMIPLILECSVAKSEWRYSSMQRSPYAIVITGKTTYVRTVYRHARSLTSNMDVRVSTNFETTVRDDILIATSGRFKFLVDGYGLNFTHTRVLVIDEADTMHRRDDLVAFYEILLHPTWNVNRRQTLVFSQTFPKKIEIFSHPIVLKPNCLATVTCPTTVYDETSYIFLVPEMSDKYDRFIGLMVTKMAEVDHRYTRQTLVFANRHLVHSLATSLNLKGVESYSINGQVPAALRAKAIREFCQGFVAVLVITDSCARDIDMDDQIDFVHYNLPGSFATYSRRMACAGRIHPGSVTSLIEDPDRNLLVEIRNDFEQSGKEVPESLTAAIAMG